MKKHSAHRLGHLALHALVFLSFFAIPSFAGEGAFCEYDLSDGGRVRVDVLDEGLFRVRRMENGEWPESGLTRYSILKTDWQAPKSFRRTATGGATAKAEFYVDAKKGAVRFRSLVSPADVETLPAKSGEGYDIRFSLLDGERIYGLGDTSRANLNRNPGRYHIFVKNNVSNIPVPMVVSRGGWGMLLNSTWINYFDIGTRERDAMFCEAEEGPVDYYFFVGSGYPELLDAYTRLSGRSALLPAFAFGVSFVCNQHIDQFNLMNDARHFRDYDLPCDVLGLEPGWMSEFYDKSVHKRFDRSKFSFPYWAPTADFTWPNSLLRIGFKLSLWLCCNYDLTLYEEQCATGCAKPGAAQARAERKGDLAWTDNRITGEKDEKLQYPYGIAGMEVIERAIEDEYPEGTLPWFEHLKKFVDRGARCFKLDGANQLGPSRREWANGMKHEEVKNLYPLIYGKQMGRGYEDYTSRRAMVYSAGGYAGIQQYVATWAGDTGGGKGSLMSVLNLAVSGHSNQSCDMDVKDPASLHYGVLLPWAQMNNWDGWLQPWFYGQETLDAIREYWNLRYRLAPYLYAQAAKCSRTGWPVMRMLPLVYPENPAYDKCPTTYMLGDDLLVSAFTNITVIPPGVWHDWKTGAKVVGPCEVEEKIDCLHGGGLYVRSGAVLPTWPKKSYIEKGWNDEVILEVWPSSDGTGELYEDDGDSLEYRKGAYALTPISVKTSDGKVVISVGRRVGSYRGMPATRRIKARVHLPGRVEEVDLGDVGEEGASASVPAERALPKPAPFAKGERVAFIGDSITHGGTWVGWLKFFVETRLGGGVELLNCGIAGDSAWNVKHRIKWDILPQRPDRAFVMLGMNDSGSEEWTSDSPTEAEKAKRARRFARYRSYMNNILDQLAAANVKVTLVTPSPYDEYSTVFKTPPCKGRNERALFGIAAIVRELAAERNLPVVDFHERMTELQKKWFDSIHLCRADRVHPNAVGGLEMGLAAADALGLLAADAPAVEVSADPEKKSAGVEFLADGGVRFAYNAKFLPLPMEGAPAVQTLSPAEELVARAAAERVVVKDLPAGTWALKADGRELGRFSAEEFAAGVDLSRLKTPAQAAAAAAHKACTEWVSKVARLRDVMMMRQQTMILKGDPMDTKSAHAALEKWRDLPKNKPYLEYFTKLIKNFLVDNERVPELLSDIEAAGRGVRAASAARAYVVEISRADSVELRRD